VLGDLNDFQFSDTVHILEGGATPILFDMIDTLPANQQYSYEFEGNAQVLDHILATSGVKNPAFDVVHINAEFWDQLSDHDPSVLRVLVNDAPTASAGGPYAVDEGSSVTLTATASDANGDALTYSWDFGSDGTQDATGATASYSALDGPADVPVTLTVSDGTTSTKVTTTIHIANVPPTATFVAPATVLAGDPIALALTGATDASSVDRGSLQFAFDCGSGFGPFSSTATASCPTDSAGSRVVRGAVRDKDGGQTVYTATVQVQVTVDSLCALVTSWAKNAGQANSLCVKLAHGQIAAFGHEVDAQTGKEFTEEQAATLKRLASQL
jgi:hypothetical protein